MLPVYLISCDFASVVVACHPVCSIFFFDSMHNFHYAGNSTRPTVCSLG